MFVQSSALQHANLVYPCVMLRIHNMQSNLRPVSDDPSSSATTIAEGVNELVHIYNHIYMAAIYDVVTVFSALISTLTSSIITMAS